MTHEELCERARRWLSGRFRCKPVYSRLASCTEIPDAIGWSSLYGICGSIVVECKISASDFYADKKKRIAWKDPDGYFIRSDRPDEELLAGGYERTQLPRMGDFRYFLCPFGVISPEMIAKHAPDHGLAYTAGRSVRAGRKWIIRPRFAICGLRF